MLQQQITEDLKNALKNSDSAKTGTLRMVLAVFQNKEIEKKGKGSDPVLTEEEITEILFKEAKKRKEAIDAYVKGGRGDLVQKEKEELDIIQKYLPKQMGGKEVEKAVSEILKKIDIGNQNNFGKVMGEVMKKLRGMADAKLVGEAVKKKLSGNQ